MLLDRIVLLYARTVLKLAPSSLEFISYDIIFLSQQINFSMHIKRKNYQLNRV